ncbi:uncharacterized protein LOC113366024 [Ctenocephalides felis]|uniref:uncharacterized protein LOC113366024 n=1 Tax=Ctenocephalides felis TaxID=7515 RepID=UPI000E6E5428|nr:uncharacterized protein LOC113366024 [Ctenocephalides felis]
MYREKTTKSSGAAIGEIKEVRATVTDDSLEMEIDLMFDNLIFEGNYKFDGGVNLFQIHTKGFFNISMEGVSTTWAVKGELEERDGEKYMVIKEADMSPVPSNVNIYATNIFPDKAVNDAFLVTMNQNWRSLYKEALPY